MELGAIDSAFDEEDLPGVFCPECSSIRYEGEPSCATCLAPRPAGGWFPLEESDDPYLGCVVDGRYLITKREASGGSAVVYRAQSIHDDHLVALKIARLAEPGSVDHSRARERMSREVRAVQMLENPHIVPIYEFLELDGGAAAIVMEYVVGQTAEELVADQGAFAIERAVDVVRQVASGLGEAHRSELIHRDIKPANIMIEEGDEDQSYILDFGIVRLQAATQSTQGFIGTPLYASPEQIRMQQLDARTDVYSLGATLYHLLAGAPPFEDDEMMEVMRAHLDTPVPRLEPRRGEAVPAELEDLVRRMLAKDRDDRPGELERVREQLDAVEQRLEAASSPEWNDVDPDATAPGFQAPNFSTEDLASRQSDESAQQDEASDREPGRPALGHVGEFDNPASSAEFTPAASGTTEFGSRGGGTDEFEFDGRAAADETQPGLQPPSAEIDSRELAAEHSIDFWPEDSDEYDVEARDEPQLESVDCFETRDGESFVVVEDSGHVWRVDDREERTAEYLSEYGDPVTAIGVGEDHAWLGLEDGRVERLRLADGLREPAVAAGSSAPIADIAVAGDESSIAVGTEAGELLYCHRELGPGWERHDGGEPIDAVAMAEDGSRIVVARRDCQLESFRPGASASEDADYETDRRLRRLAVASSGDVLGAIFRDGGGRILHARTGREVAEIRASGADVESLFFDSSGDLYGVERGDDGWIVRDLAGDRVVAEVSQVAAVRRR